MFVFHVLVKAVNLALELNLVGRICKIGWSTILFHSTHPLGRVSCRQNCLGSATWWRSFQDGCKLGKLRNPRNSQSLFEHGSNQRESHGSEFTPCLEDFSPILSLFETVSAQGLYSCSVRIFAAWL